MTIDDSSSAQKPNVTVPCPTRKQGCDNSQENGQLETCHGSHNGDMTLIEEKLLQECAIITNLTDAEVLAKVNDPDWQSSERMYDWRNHVCNEVRTAWCQLAIESRMACMLNGASLAAIENWDHLLADQ
ncbi:MAG: hypothetical protein JNM18_03660 [Planctomycetaceae bacterium]|nr:hypothetical protein [Planctomycetaceae bacterium]